jgi:hypothetical protein
MKSATIREGTSTSDPEEHYLSETQDTIIDESRECHECHVLKEKSAFGSEGNTCSDCQRYLTLKRQRKASNRVLERKATEEKLAQLRASARSKKQENQNRKRKATDACKQLQAKRIREALP